MQNFFINKNSTNPSLRIEIINDGRYDFGEFYNAVQDSMILFSMKNTETDILKISNAPAKLVLIDDGGCEEKYAIAYEWKERDTKEEGIFKGWFNIKFNGNITEYGVNYPNGNLIVPIEEDLMIYIK